MAKTLAPSLWVPPYLPSLFQSQKSDNTVSFNHSSLRRWTRETHSHIPRSFPHLVLNVAQYIQYMYATQNVTQYNFEFLNPSSPPHSPFPPSPGCIGFWLEGKATAACDNYVVPSRFSNNVTQKRRNKVHLDLLTGVPATADLFLSQWPESSLDLPLLCLQTGKRMNLLQ